MSSAGDLCGMTASACMWVLCGRSRITPLTRSTTASLAQEIEEIESMETKGQFCLLTASILPTGSASPKYLRASDCDSTMESGCLKTEAALPATRGKRITWKKLLSTST